MSVNNDRLRVSVTELEEASDSIVKRASAIEDALLDFINCADGTTAIWNGGSAEEFRRRCAAYRAPVRETAADISECMRRLSKITELYEETESHVSKGGTELPSDAIL